MTETQKDNRKRALEALAILIGTARADEFEAGVLPAAYAKGFDGLGESQKEEVLKLYREKGLDRFEKTDERVAERDIQKEIADIGNEAGVEYYRIAGVSDGKTCPDCASWHGKIVTMRGTDPNYPEVQDFINDHGFHPHCRCSLQALTTTEIERKHLSMNTKISEGMETIENDRTEELAKLAQNSEPITDQTVYRGFVDETLDPDITYDFGETLVMISPLGTFVGSTPEGKPQDEIVDEDSVRLMTMQTEEILLDRDHGSMRPTAGRDTQAMGWISGLKALTNLGDMSGLYGVIKWTEEGRRLVETRAYRFLSPVFQLDENDKAIRLLNVGLTNRPALKTPPIINGEPETEDRISITKTEEDIQMTKEEIIQIVKDTIDGMKPAETTAENECAEKNEETKAEEVKNEEVKAEETKTEEVKTEETETSSETKPETTETEVIKEEALNSAPVPELTKSYENLHGEEFFDWCRKNGFLK